jgi:hypothetical protein
MVLIVIDNKIAIFEITTIKAYVVPYVVPFLNNIKWRKILIPLQVQYGFY